MRAYGSRRGNFSGAGLKLSRRNKAANGESATKNISIARNLYFPTNTCPVDALCCSKVSQLALVAMSSRPPERVFLWAQRVLCVAQPTSVKHWASYPGRLQRPNLICEASYILPLSRKET